MRDAVPLGARPGGDGSGDDEEEDAGASPGDDGGDGTEVRNGWKGWMGRMFEGAPSLFTHSCSLSFLRSTTTWTTPTC